VLGVLGLTLDESHSGISQFGGRDHEACVQWSVHHCVALGEVAMNILGCGEGGWVDRKGEGWNE